MFVPKKFGQFFLFESNNKTKIRLFMTVLYLMTVLMKHPNVELSSIEFCIWHRCLKVISKVIAIIMLNKLKFYLLSIYINNVFNLISPASSFKYSTFIEKYYKFFKTLKRTIYIVFNRKIFDLKIKL